MPVHESRPIRPASRSTPSCVCVWSKHPTPPLSNHFAMLERSEEVAVAKLKFRYAKVEVKKRRRMERERMNK